MNMLDRTRAFAVATADSLGKHMSYGGGFRSKRDYLHAKSRRKAAAASRRANR